MPSKLVVVESTAKVKTIAKILGSEYRVCSCQGHIFDLPKSALGVDVEHDFKPTYVSTDRQKKALAAITKAANGVGVVYLATDPDREGEAIAAHLGDALYHVPAERITFNEITPEALKHAVAHPRELDRQLVAAQQTRRILDRLVGYSVSPVLWKNVKPGLSAGRVQSVAVRLVCERDAEIEAFVPVEYWTLAASFATAAGESFAAALVTADGETLMAPGRTEKYDRRLATEDDARAMSERAAAVAYKVIAYKEGKKRRAPGPPFTTSTMQQAAARLLGYTGTKTMAVAQRLYEGVDLGGGKRVGLITYMRTDAVRVAASAKEAARKYIAGRFGAEYLPPQPRAYRSRRGAQEAHEAVRPTDARRSPEDVRAHLKPEEAQLYALIYRRFLASQMADAVYDTVATDVEGDGLVFHAAAQRVAFPGWLAVSPVEEKDAWLPPLTVGEELTLAAVTPEQHYTEPPPRYNDASLVRALEGFGIGRPSTYAPIVATILERGYVERRSRAFYATELGKLVNALLVAAFPDVFNVKFTAHVESELDRVEEGNTDGVEVLREFYAPFAADLTRAADVMNAVRDDAVEPTDVPCPKCGASMEIRWGRYGKYLRCQRHPDCRETMDFERDASGKVIAAPPAATGEVCPSCGAPMVVKQGRFGKFLACTKYPECKTTKPIRKKTGAVCPKCGGQVLVVPGRGRGKRPFYGCEKYPDCDFVSSSLPVNEPCPKCGSPYLVKGRGGSSRCPVKGCGYKNAS